MSTSNQYAQLGEQYINEAPIVSVNGRVAVQLFAGWLDDRRAAETKADADRRFGQPHYGHDEEKDWPTLAAESYEANHPNLPSVTAPLQRTIERHVRWRAKALEFFHQILDGRGTEDEWPALAEFVKNSETTLRPAVKTRAEPTKCLVAECPEPTADGQAMCAEHIKRIEP